MLCVIAKGAAGSLIAITTNKKQVDTQWYFITVMGLPP
jgi:hypothetical protein